VSPTLVKLEDPKRPSQRGGFGLPRLARFIQAVFPRAVGAMFLWAASMKVWDESGVRRVLEFDGLPQALLPAAVSLVIVVECAVGLLLLLRPATRFVLDAAVVLLTLYAAQLLYLAAFRDAPNCVCLSAWRAYHDARFDNLMGVGRNVCLILALLWVRARSVARATSP
jgi:uncharacterized membrane protein YphA (DoxX/SURF4 family)